VKPNWPLIIRQIVAQSDCQVIDLAKHCQCSKAAVEQWQQGLKRPNFENGWQLLNAYVSNVSKRIPQL